MLSNLELKFYSGNIYYYANGIYKPATTEFLNSYITNYICRAATKSKKASVRDYVQDILYNRKRQEINKNYIAFKNGIYDLKNDKFIPSSPDIFLINQLNINYLEDLPNANHEVDKYVDEIMFHKEERKKSFHQIVGYCLTSKNDLQVLFFWYGPTASNGKSMATNIITRMVGKSNICHIALDEFAEKFAKIGIADKLLNISTEVPNKKLMDTAVLKQTVSGDVFEGNIKHVQKRPEVKAYIKHIICANEFPQVRDKTDGYYRRFNILVFENKFDPKTSKFNIDDFCTQKNLDYLGNTALRCYIETCKEDEFVFANIEESDKLLMQYKERNDTIMSYLRDEDSLVNVPEFDIKKTRILEDYRKYCRENKLIALPKREFYKELLEKSDIEERRLDGIWYFYRKNNTNTKK